MCIDAFGIPKEEIQDNHALVAAAAKDYFKPKKMFSKQKQHRKAAAISYLEEQALRLAECVRSRGACSLLSLKAKKRRHTRDAPRAHARRLP